MSGRLSSFQTAHVWTGSACSPLADCACARRSSPRSVVKSEGCMLNGKLRSTIDVPVVPFA